MVGVIFSQLACKYLGGQCALSEQIYLNKDTSMESVFLPKKLRTKRSVDIKSLNTLLLDKAEIAGLPGKCSHN